MDSIALIRKQLEEADPDLLRDLLHGVIQELMGSEVDALAGAGFRERSAERVNRRNGYRERRFDTRLGTIDLRIPKLRSGSYFPSWLLEPRRRAERALVAVVAEAYVLGVSTRRVEDLVQTLGISGISKSQVSELAKTLDGEVEAFRRRPLDGAPYRVLSLDATGAARARGRPHRLGRSTPRHRREPRGPPRDLWLRRGRGAARGGARRAPRLHQFPARPLAAAVVDQSAGALEPGAPPALGRRRHLPQPRRDRAAHRFSPERAARRVAGDASLHGAREPREDDGYWRDPRRAVGVMLSNVVKCAA